MKRLVVLICIIFVIIFSGCESESSSTKVEIRPQSLFQGKSKLLESHLDMYTGMAEISYDGEKSNFKVYVQQWKAGQLIDELMAINLYDSPSGYDIPVSISLKAITEGEHRLKLIVDGMTSTTKVKLPEDEYFNVEELEEVIHRSDNQRIIIWGLKGAEMGESYKSYINDLQKTMKEAETALVLMIEFE